MSNKEPSKNPKKGEGLNGTELNKNTENKNVSNESSNEPKKKPNSQPVKRATFGAAQNPQRNKKDNKVGVIATAVVLSAASLGIAGTVIAKQIIKSKNPTYTVTLVTNVDGLEVPSVTLKKGARLSDITVPQKPGYYFEGFYSNEAMTEEFRLSLNTEITENITIYMHYIQLHYELNLYGDTDNLIVTMANGDEIDENSIIYQSKLKVTYLLKAGHTMKYINFVGLEKEGDFVADKTTEDGTYYTAIFNVIGSNTNTSLQDIQLYIDYDQTINKYTVTYLKEDGSVYSTRTNIPYHATNLETLCNIKGPDKESDHEYKYTFDGWLDEQNRKIDWTTYKIENDLSVKASYTKTAIDYKVNITGNSISSVEIYKVDTNGNKITDNIASELLNGEVSLRYNDRIMISYRVRPGHEKVDFKIDGYSSLNDTIITVTRTVNIVYNDKINMYNVGSIPEGVTVTYLDNGVETKAVSYQEFEYGTKLTISYVVKDGYEIVGDFTVNDVRFINGSTLELTEDIVIHFEQKVKPFEVIVLNEEGTEIKRLKCDFGTQVKLDPLNRGSSETTIYIFEGWEDTDGNLWIDATGNVTEKNKVTGPVTLRPKFREEVRTYSVKITKVFDGEGGSLTVTMDGNEVTNDTLLEFNDTFTISYTSSVGRDGTLIVKGATDNGDGTYTVTGDVTISYTEVITMQTVTIYDYDGTKLSEEQVEWGKALILATEPERAEDNTYTYRFSCWKSQPNGQGNTVSINQITEDISIYAWYDAIYKEYDVNISITIANDGEVNINKVDAENGDVPLTNGATIHYGDIVKIDITESTGYDAVLNVTGATQNEDGTYTVTGNLTITYTETYEKYTVTIPNNPHLIVMYTDGGATISNGDQVLFNSNITIKATPNEGYHADVFTINGQDYSKFATGEDIYITIGTDGLVIEYSEAINKYTVTLDIDGTIKEYTVQWNTTLDVENPEKESDERYDYTFENWLDENDEVVSFNNIKKDIHATAKFSKTHREYTISNIPANVTVKFLRGTSEHENTILANGDKLHFGDVVQLSFTATAGKEMTAFTVNGETISSGDEFTFEGKMEIVYTEDYIGYTIPTFDSHVTIVYVSGTSGHTTNKQLSTGDTIHYGDILKISYKASEGHTKSVFTVNGDDFIDGDTIEYAGKLEIVYAETINTYTVTYYDYDGTTILGTKTVDWDTVSTIADPVRESDETYDYTFENWVTEKDGDTVADLTHVKSDMVVYAKYSNKYIEYHITITSVKADSVTITYAGGTAVDSEGNLLQVGTKLTETNTLHYGDRVIVAYTESVGMQRTTFTVNGNNISTGSEYTIAGAINVVYVEDYIDYRMAIEDYVNDAHHVVVTYVEGTSGYNANTILDASDTIHHGDKIRITVNPTVGYDVSLLQVNGTDFTAGESFVIDVTGKDVNAGLTINYNEQIKVFEIQSSDIHVVITNERGQELYLGDTVEYGTKLYFECNPDSGFKVDVFQVNGEDIENGGEYIVTDHINVTFEQVLNSFTVNFDSTHISVGYVNTDGIFVDVLDGDSVVYGTQIQIVFNASIGHHLTTTTISTTTTEAGTSDDTSIVTGNLSSITRTVMVEGETDISFTEEINQYVVNYYSYDGSQLLYTETVNHNDTTSYKSDTIPTRADTVAFTFRYKGWSLYENNDGTTVTLGAVTEDINLYAAFDVYYREYALNITNPDHLTITFISGDSQDDVLSETSHNEGDVLTSADKLHYGDIIQVFYTIYDDFSLESIEINDNSVNNGARYTVIGDTNVVCNETWAYDYLEFAQVDGGYAVTALKDKTRTIIQIPDNYKDGSPVVLIDEGAFQNEAITSISFGKNVKEVGINAFRGANLDRLVIPDTIQVICEGAFAAMGTLTSVSIGKGVTAIDANAFANLPNLEYLYYNAPSVGDFNQGATLTQPFAGSATARIGMLEVEFGPDCRRIPAYFMSPDSMYGSIPMIKSIKIHDNVESIGYSAFQYCNVAEEIYIGTGVKTIGDFAFNVHSDSELDTINYAAIDATSGTYTQDFRIFPQGVVRYNLNITDDVNILPSYIFCGTSANSIIIGKNVRAVGTNCFYNLLNVETLYYNAINITAGFLESETDNTSRDFYNLGLDTPNGTSVIFGDYVVNIPASLFYVGTSSASYKPKISSVFISSGVTTIGDKAFQYLDTLATVTIESSDIFMAADGTGSEDAGGLLASAKDIYVLKQVVDVYDNNWLENSTLFYKFDEGEYYRFAENTDAEYYYLDFTLLDDDTYAVSGLNDKTVTDIKIPLIHNSKYVKSIAAYAFKDCTDIVSITIPNNITSIGVGVFSGCNSLTTIKIEDGNEVYTSKAPDGTECNAVLSNGGKTLHSGCITTVIPNNVTTINIQAFNNLTTLTTIDIPSSVTTISYAAFKGTGLTEITLKEGLDLITQSAFESCNNLTKITLPNSLQTIGEYCFANCGKLETLNLGSSVKTIGEKAFYNCTSLTELNIPSSVTTIEANAFENCVLETITLNNGIQVIGMDAFKKDSSTIPSVYFVGTIAEWVNIDFGNEYANPIWISGGLTINGELITTLNIPDGVTNIKAYAFYNCTNITSITLPDSLTTISSYAFFGCTGVESITIPSSVEAIAPAAFDNCNLTTVTIDSQNVFTAALGASIINAGGLLANATDVYVPKYIVEGFDNSYLENTDNFYRVNAGEDYYLFTKDPDKAVFIVNFYDYDGTLLLKSTVGLHGNAVYSKTTPTRADDTDYSGYLFDKWVTEQNGMTAATLTDIQADTDVYASYTPGTYVGDLVFTLVGDVYRLDGFSSGSSRSDLTIPLTYLGKNVTSINDSAFANQAITTLSYGNNSKTMGQSNLISIGNRAFYSTQLTGQLDIPNTVTTLGDYAFAYNSSINYLDLGNKLVTIGNYCFANCTSIRAENYASDEDWIQIPDSVETIGNYAFYSICPNYLTIGKGVKNLGVNAFGNIKSLDYLYFEAISCNDISSYANSPFNGCEINYLSFENGCTRVPNYMFASNTTSISSPTIKINYDINITDSVTYIGKGAFRYSQLSDYVEIGRGVKSIGEEAFYSSTSSTSTDIYYYATDASSVAYTASSRVFPQYSTGARFDLIIEDNVTNIPACLFYSSGIEELTIGTNVKTLGSWAFEGCRYMNRIDYNATAINDLYNETNNRGGNRPFRDCGRFGDGIHVTFGSNVTKIPAGLFYVQDSTNMNYIPNVVDVTLNCPNLNYIGDRAFQYLLKLSHVKIGQNCHYAYNITGKRINSQSKYGGGLLQNTTSVEVHTSVVNRYEYWSHTNSDGTTSSGYYTNSNAYLNDSTIYSKSSDPGPDSYYTYALLQYFNFRQRVSGVNSYEITGLTDTSLTNITILPYYAGKKIEGIASNAFYNNDTLQKVTFHPSVGIRTIGSNAFYDCDNLDYVYMSSSIETIGGHAFYSCGKLTSIDGWNPLGIKSIDLKTIGTYAFAECYALVNIFIPAGVTSIEQFAFGNCRGVKNLYFWANNCADFGAYNHVFYHLGEDVGGTNVYFYGINIPGCCLSPEMAYGSNLSIKGIYISENVRRVGNYAFYYASSGCTIAVNLKSTLVWDDLVYNNPNYGGGLLSVAKTIDVPYDVYNSGSTYVTTSGDYTQTDHYNGATITYITFTRR